MMWPRYGYLLVLLVSLFGVAFFDYRNKITLWIQPGHTLLTLLGSVAVFSLWDAAGIALHIFYTNPRYVIGIGFANYPVEELLLLTLISYLTLIGLRWPVRTR